MKKLFIVSLLLMVVCAVQAQDTEVITDVIATVEQTVEQTTSFGKEVYNDAKEAIAQLGEALGVASEYVFEILVRQQMINVFMWLLSIPFIIFLPVLLMKSIKYGIKIEWLEEEGTFTILFAIITGLALLGAIIWFFAMLHTGATGLFNPEYGALKDVISMIYTIGRL